MSETGPIDWNHLHAQFRASVNPEELVKLAQSLRLPVASLLALSGPLHVRMSGRATYAGAKAFLLTFTQSLAQELEGTGVHAMVCLPGMVETEFHGVRRGDAPAPPSMMSAPDVAQAIVAGLELGETVCAPTLEDATLFERLGELQRSALAAARSTELAARYRR